MNKLNTHGNQRQRAFTIVELLIVIVVIAILAAVAVATYTGIQDKARNARYMAAVDVYTKAMIAYKNQHGQYYITATDGTSGASSTVCLGDNYPAAGAFSAGRCYAGATGNNYRLDTGANDAAREFISALPHTSDMVFTSSRGLWYQSDYGTSASISYFIKGNQTCARGEKLTDGSITRCFLIIGMGS